MRLYSYHILFEAFNQKDGVLPAYMEAETFYNEKKAQAEFIELCNDRALRWQTIMEGNDDWILIAQAGGIDQQYRILYFACPIF